MMKSKTVKVGIIFFAILIVLLIVDLILNSSTQKDIKEYLISMGYSVESDDESRLFKTVDGTTIDYFSVAEYTMTRNIDDTNNEVKYSLTIKYDFKTHEITFNYRTLYSNNVNMIFKGTYINDEYVCDKEFSTVKLSEAEVDNTCALIKINVERFYKETQILFSNPRLVEYMESVTLE